ncbi:DUF6042 family protein, partial [Frankia sp. CiP3]|uniref:DUF6042 family protein n=1 Tax=Frankia sp. CiP3 TaxID=2880971 RepID=UPI0035ABF035
MLLRGQPRPEFDVLAEVDCHSGQPLGPDQRVWDEPELSRDVRGERLYDMYAEDMDAFLRGRARIDAAAAELGLPPPRTVADTATYLVAADVLCRIVKDGTILLVPAWPVPLPEEQLTLTDEERRAEDAQRWNLERRRPRRRADTL